MTTADYTAAPYTVKMTQGDTLHETFVFRDDTGDTLDLSGYTFASQVRESAAGSAVATFDIDTDDAEVGRISRSLGTAVTSGLVGRFVHDFEWVDPDGKRRTLIGGPFEVSAEVTRV